MIMLESTHGNITWRLIQIMVEQCYFILQQEQHIEDWAVQFRTLGDMNCSLRLELGAIDAQLGNRAAFDGMKSRVEKIQQMLAVAARCEQAQAENKRLTTENANLKLAIETLSSKVVAADPTPSIEEVSIDEQIADVESAIALTQASAPIRMSDRNRKRIDLQRLESQRSKLLDKRSQVAAIGAST